MIEDAEAKGLLKEGSVIIEPTSGNYWNRTGSGSNRKRLSHDPYHAGDNECGAPQYCKAYGAEVVLTDGTKGMKGAIEKADELAKEIPEQLYRRPVCEPGKPGNPQKTTGPEIWEDTDGEVDIFVAGVGTGGTITGTGEYLKEKNRK